ncbi:MAG: site-specific DNA-methyltransferase [Chloroflexota bacterium]|nr:site-specific DNA-methyltransferase [Chloroflexota bacterium]
MLDYSKKTVAQQRGYLVKSTEEAKQIGTFWLEQVALQNAVEFGLPEIDDRSHVWRVPLVRKETTERLGEIVIDARTSLIQEEQTTATKILEARLLGRNADYQKPTSKKKNYPKISALHNIVACGDSETVLTEELPSNSVDLVFTSPPYFNARPEYTDYLDYDEYLLKLRKVIRAAHHVLNEGRFFVINVSPVLIRRENRTKASRRIAVPFDLHRLFMEEGFDFIDDIIWVKPSGAGWATGRGRRFAADRNPLQYKAVPVTEYVLVYRKQTEHLIDWSIRFHPDQQAVADSRIEGAYETTNIWRITPAHDSRHPAIFPLELAEKVIKYYSFKNDVVLDPFAGIGTTGKAAAKLGRRFVLIEKEPEYAQIILKEAKGWLGEKELEKVVKRL